MKIFHCADLHLESPFSGLDTETANDRRQELSETFSRMMRYAKDESVSAVLIAGDLFDSIYCGENTKRDVFDALASVGCPVVISPGNHDYYSKGCIYSDAELPENVYVFKSQEMGRFDLDEVGISVCGYAFTTYVYEKDPLSDICELSKDNINLLCAHADIRDKRSKTAPIDPAALAGTGFVYAALGHVHMPPEPRRYGACTVAYSGFAQGRSFDEIGYGGARLVEIDDGGRTVKTERVIFSGLHYETEKLDVTACERDTEIINRINGLIKSKGYDGDTALRVVLSGAVNSSYTPSRRRIVSEAGAGMIRLIDIKDETSPTFDLDGLERDKTLRGEFYRLLLPELASPDARERKCASLALRYGLAALDRREISIMSEGSDDAREN